MINERFAMIKAADRSSMTKRQHIRVPGSASADVIKLIIPRLLPLRAADRC